MMLVSEFIIQNDPKSNDTCARHKAKNGVWSIAGKENAGNSRALNMDGSVVSGAECTF